MMVKSSKKQDMTKQDTVLVQSTI